MIPDVVERAFRARWEKSNAAERRAILKALGLEGVPVDEPQSPSVTLSERAARRAQQKGIPYVEALNEVKAENPQLVERVARAWADDEAPVGRSWELAEADDPRAELAALASVLARHRGLSFRDALEAAKASRPDLLQRVGMLYASGRG
jgi:hypothetical protein